MRLNKDEKAGHLLDFNLKECLLLLFFLTNGNRPSYPAQIERELPESKIFVGWPEGTEPARITRRWAKTICERLEQEGVMGSLLGKARRRRNVSKHYFLKDDLDSFRRIFGTVAPFFGGYLLSTRYSQEIIENQLIKSLEEMYETEFDEETRANMVVTLFLSPKAVQLGLTKLVLPISEEPPYSEKAKERLNQTLLAIFQSALLTDLVQSGLAWRRSKVDEIDFGLETKIRIGETKASISTRMKYVSDLQNDVLPLLRIP